MSVRVLSLVFRESQSKGSARLVLLALADVAADTGEVTAYARSQSVLAEKANVDTGTVRKALRSLEEIGEVEVLVVGDGRKKSDYLIHLPGLGVDSDGQSQGQGGPDAPPITPSSSGKPSSSKRTSEPDESFEAWWKTYPQRDGYTRGNKQKAWAAWDRLATETREMVIRATPHYAATIIDPHFVMDAVRFITSRMYADLQEPPPRTGKKGRTAADMAADRERARRERGDS